MKFELTGLDIKERLPTLSNLELAEYFAKIKWLQDNLEGQLKELLKLAGDFKAEILIDDTVYLVKCKAQSVETKEVTTTEIDYKAAIEFAKKEGFTLPYDTTYDLVDAKNGSPILLGVNKDLKTKIIENKYLNEDLLERQDWFQMNIDLFSKKVTSKVTKEIPSKVTVFRK